MKILFLTLLACGEKDPQEPDTTIDGTDTEDTDTEDTDTPQDPLPIIGEYEDNWGGSHSITAEQWTSGSLSFTISQYDNEEQTLVAQNASSNEYNPDLWSLFQWSYNDQEELVYCQVAFDAATEEDAGAATLANTSSLETGCGGFEWTTLRAPLSISGDYDDNWGGSHSITAFRWSIVFGNADPDIFHIVETNEEEMYIIAENDENNAFNTDRWSKFEWVSQADTLYYCQSAYDALSQGTAGLASADRADLDTGCGGSSWSILTP